jgi:hypothetical protein
MAGNVLVYLAMGFFTMALFHRPDDRWLRVMDVLLWPVLVVPMVAVAPAWFVWQWLQRRWYV